MKQGEIWLVNYEPSRKGEFGKAGRPSIVIQNNDACEMLNTATVIPLSSDIDQPDEMYVLLQPSKLNGLKKESVAVCSHIYTVSEERLVKKIGMLNLIEFNNILRGVAIHLDLD